MVCLPTSESGVSYKEFNDSQEISLLGAELDFDAKTVPKIVPKASQNAPLGHPGAPKSLPKTPSEHLQTPPETPNIASRRPRGAQGTSEAPWGAFCLSFWSPRGSIWLRFGSPPVTKTSYLGLMFATFGCTWMHMYVTMIYIHTPFTLVHGVQTIHAVALEEAVSTNPTVQ